MGLKAINEIIGQYQISKGLSKRDLKKVVKNPKSSSIQFASPLSKKDVDLLENYVFSLRPDISLRIYGHYGEECDLSFLERIPSLRKVSADCLMEAKGIEAVTKLKDLELLGIGIYNLTNFDFLENVNSGLKELLIHQTKSKRPKINCIQRFSNLEYLYLEGQQKGIESISELKKLKKIVLRSITTDDLSFLAGLHELWSVDIKLGGIKNFDTIQTLPNIKHLELWQIRGLSNLSFISQLTSLQNLFIQSLKQVSKLPDTKNLKHLNRIYLENLKGLDDMSSLEFTPKLKEFIYVLAQNQDPKDLLPVLKNKSVQKVTCLFGSDKKNNAFDQLAIEYGKTQYTFKVFEYK